MFETETPRVTGPERGRDVGPSDWSPWDEDGDTPKKNKTKNPKKPQKKKKNLPLLRTSDPFVCSEKPPVPIR